jgi:hypothetical protein
LRTHRPARPPGGAGRARVRGLFTAADGETFTTARTTLVSGRLLTWYGPSLLEAARS